MSLLSKMSSFWNVSCVQELSTFLTNGCVISQLLSEEYKHALVCCVCSDETFITHLS